MKEINIEELEQMIDSGSVDIYDVREVDEFAEGHLAGSINIPLSQLTSEFSKIKDNSYLICRSGHRSQLAGLFLADQGITTTNIAGGILAWQGELE